MKSNNNIDSNQISFKKNIKSNSSGNKNIINFNQSKENFSMSLGRKSNDGSPNQHFIDGLKLIDSISGTQKVHNFKVIKNSEMLKKSDTNLNKLNSNQKSLTSLKVLPNSEMIKLPQNNQGNNSSNSNNLRSSSNMQKLHQVNSGHVRKNSENIFIIKGSNLNMLNNIPNNNSSEKSSISQIRQEQFNKTGAIKPFDLIGTETERNVKSKHEHLFRSERSPNVKKSNNFLIGNNQHEENKSEFPQLYLNNNNNQEEESRKRAKEKQLNSGNIEENHKSLRVTLNKNFSKGNLMSNKLFENSQNTNNLSLKNSSSTSGFPKIKSSSNQDQELKREPSPVSDNDSHKVIRQVTNKKISIDDRKTSSLGQNRREEDNSSKNIVDGKKDAKKEGQETNIIRVFNVKSRAGMNYDGTRKTNQDNYISKTNLLGLEDYHIFGVFDGHGLHGHFVSSTVKQYFTEFYNRLEIYNNRTLKFTKTNIKEQAIYERLKESDYEFIKTSFFRCEQELSRTKFEVNFSGTTSVVALIIGNKIIIANAGDSRAIMVVKKKNKSITDDIEEKQYEPIQLSRDHKPDLDDERERIIACNGRVDKYTENGIKSGPYRVWLKNENFPGLAMSRSLGDFVAASVGCICEPGKIPLIEEINEYELNSESKFIVIASDGVWEFLSNKRVMDIIMPFYKNNDPSGATEKIIEESVKCWKKEDEVIDDITAVVIFLNKI